MNIAKCICLPRPSWLNPKPIVELWVQYCQFFKNWHLFARRKKCLLLNWNHLFCFQSFFQFCSALKLFEIRINCFLLYFDLAPKISVLFLFQSLANFSVTGNKFCCLRTVFSYFNCNVNAFGWNFPFLKSIKSFENFFGEKTENVRRFRSFGIGSTCSTKRSI